MPRLVVGSRAYGKQGGGVNGKSVPIFPMPCAGYPSKTMGALMPMMGTHVLSEEWRAPKVTDWMRLSGTGRYTVLSGGSIAAGATNGSVAVKNGHRAPYASRLRIDVPGCIRG